MEIQVLDSSVIDKIAAGEVLERPAQLVKELVENSLDAGATSIEVDISSGASQITVKDNGSGIPPKDLELALTRHATSKIRKVEDLFELYSFGFRGEALSSAASVSRLTLTSRTKDHTTGFRIESEFGKLSPKVEVSSPVGSEIVVRQLFDNVPARKKFLKSDTSEVSQIKQVLKSFGMVHPKVDFRVTKEGELLFYWQKDQDSLQRVKDILSVDDLFIAHGEENGIKCQAFFGAPNQTLRQNKGIWLFVQGRSIQDRSLVAAIMESYRNLLMHGEYPHCVLFLELNPSDVDVNVHPAKSQVRFQKPSEVFRAVVHTLRDALQTTPWLQTPKIELKSVSYNDQSAHSQMTFLDRELKKTQLAKKEFILRDSETRALELSEPALAQPQFQPQSQPQFQWSSLQVIGQMARTYIVAQTESEFYLVDQHAAHERVMFERLMRDWKNGRFVTQNFLIPLTLDFSEEEVEVLLQQGLELEKMGVIIERAGPSTLAVVSVPEMIKESGVAKALQIFASQLSQHGGGFAVESAIGDIFASMACHSVIRAGQSLSEPEMKSLLQQMDEFPFSSFCPHGRPVYVKKSLYQIEKDFGRIV